MTSIPFGQIGSTGSQSDSKAFRILTEQSPRLFFRRSIKIKSRTEVRLKILWAPTAGISFLTGTVQVVDIFTPFSRKISD